MFDRPHPAVYTTVLTRPLPVDSPMTTRIGFFIFAGLILGTIVGNWLVQSAGVGALAGGAAGLVLGGALDFMAARGQGDPGADG